MSTSNSQTNVSDWHWPLNTPTMHPYLSLAHSCSHSFFRKTTDTLELTLIYHLFPYRPTLNSPHLQILIQPCVQQNHYSIIVIARECSDLRKSITTFVHRGSLLSTISQRWVRDHHPVSVAYYAFVQLQQSVRWAYTYTVHLILYFSCIFQYHFIIFSHNRHIQCIVPLNHYPLCVVHPYTPYPTMQLHLVLSNTSTYSYMQQHILTHMIWSYTILWMSFRYLLLFLISPTHVSWSSTSTSIKS